MSDNDGYAYDNLNNRVTVETRPTSATALQRLHRLRRSRAAGLCSVRLGLGAGRDHRL